MTRDVVIKGLECVTDTTRKLKRCEECVYNDGIHSGLYTCMPIRIVLDALALLKAEHTCTDCRYQNEGVCTRSGLPTRPDVFCDGWEHVEPKRGRWVQENDRERHWHCSECGHVVGLAGSCAKYCPNCGAMMWEGDT